jgi:glyoxylase-like metal-dependent hydrolase (beta-lactamase superfamily II)
MSNQIIAAIRRGGATLLLLSLAAAAQAAGPMVQAGTTQKVVDRVYVIPDNRVNLVPNIGIIVGDQAVMVVDTGMGPKNAEIVLAEARKLSTKPVRWLAITHFHPEHGMGAQAFPPETQVVVPRAQQQELADKGAAYIELFKGFSPDIAALLADVRLVSPHVAFEKSMDIDLGGITVRLLSLHPGHTRGDMLVWLPEQKLLFGGDLVLNRFFPIMPDPDSSASGWMASLDEARALSPAIIVPGHGAVGDASLIDALHAFLADAQGRVAKEKAAGRSLEQATATLEPQLRKQYAEWENRWDNPEWIKNVIERFYAGS